MVSLQGEDKPRCLTTSWTHPCKTISYALMGYNAICMKGTFPNLSETIEVSNYTNSTHDREITVKCTSCLLNNITLILDNRMDRSFHVIFVELKMKNSCIQFRNIQVTLKDVVLEQVRIQDFEKAPNQVYFEGSFLSCSDTKMCGLFLLNSIFVKCVIEDSYLEHFKLEMDIKALLLTINNTILIQPEIYLKVHFPPYLKIPSFIQFYNVATNMTGKVSNMYSNINSKIVFLLTNPYLLFSRCNFYQTHVEIVANRQRFDHAYFWTEITDSKFTNSHYEGDGGALMVISEVQNSKFFILSCIFKSNTAIKGMSKSKRRGGAISIKADTLEAVIKSCLFVGNKADDTGLDIHTSTGVRLYLMDCSFHYSVDPNNPIQQALVFIAGMTFQFQGYVQVKNTKPESYIGKISLFYIARGEDIDMEIVCPIWYRHTFQHSSVPTGDKGITEMIYECNPCSDNYYFASNVKRILSYSKSGNTSVVNSPNTDQTRSICTKCPYGAICTGNNVMPSPNYWGYWYNGKLKFIQCPAGYCCSGSDSTYTLNKMLVEVGRGWSKRY